MRLTAPKFTAVPTQLSRRTVLGALPATMVLAACSSGGTDDASFDAKPKTAQQSTILPGTLCCANM